MAINKNIKAGNIDRRIAEENSRFSSNMNSLLIVSYCTSECHNRGVSS